VTRHLSGFQPTGHLHLGNLLGAIAPVVAAQAEPGEGPVVMVVDLHALTLDHDPAQVRAATVEVATLLFAAGLDPDRSTCYVQSQLPEHTELHYLLECATGYGEAHRMIQFRQKSAGRDHVRLSLLTYPVLMAADILLHDTVEVPVGEDQRQHVELTRAVAARFNSRYGPVFTLPRAVNPPVAARVMDLADPTAKMSKSSPSPAGRIGLLDPPDLVRRKVMRAVTDAGREVRHDPAAAPGVANLLEILAACCGRPPADLAAQFTGYGQVKAATADAVVDLLAPIQARYRELAARPGEVAARLADGAARAKPRAAATVRRAREAMGLVTTA
jgi:tryptophanyl-tRNA synthetase